MGRMRDGLAWRIGRASACVSYRGLVQLVEHQSPKLGVGGSSPPAPANAEIAA